MFVHGRASRPERSVLTDDVLADLELAREAEFLNVAVRLGGVKADKRSVPLASLVRPLRKVLDGDEPSIRSRELPDDSPADDLVGHRSASCSEHGTRLRRFGVTGADGRSASDRPAAYRTRWSLPHVSFLRPRRFAHDCRWSASPRLPGRATTARSPAFKSRGIWPQSSTSTSWTKGSPPSFMNDSRLSSVPSRGWPQGRMASRSRAVSRSRMSDSRPSRQPSAP